MLVDQITVGDSVYTIKPHAARVEYPSEGGEIRAPETITYVTVLRIPGTVSMLRQFFEAELTVINQAGAAFAFENCTALEEVRVKAESGSIGAAAFANTPQMSVYLDVSAEYGWEGKVPEHLTVYVPSEVRDALLSSWLVSAERLIAYDFS